MEEGDWTVKRCKHRCRESGWRIRGFATFHMKHFRGPTNVIFKSLKVVNIVSGYIFVYIFRDKNKTKVEVKGKQITISLSKINLLNQLDSGGFKQKERKKGRKVGREGG